MTTLQRIVIDPAICLGQPTVRGTRITVSTILKMLAGGSTPNEVLAAYPEQGREDVQQAVQFAGWVGSDKLLVAPT